MFPNNTDYLALIIAVIALISPIYVEHLRNKNEREVNALEHERRIKERKEEFKQRDKEKEIEYQKLQSELEKKQKFEEFKELELNKQKNIYCYLKEVNKFYEVAVNGESINQDSLLSIKNSSSEVFNRLVVDFTYTDRWKYDNSYKNFDTGETLTSYIDRILQYRKDFYIGFLNISDTIQDILQRYCDDKEFDFGFLLRYHLEVLQLLLPLIFEKDTEGNIIQNVKDNITMISKKYESDKKIRLDKMDYRIGDESVPSYFTRVFDTDSELLRIIEEKLGNNDQYRRVHRKLSGKNNKSNYIKIGKEGNLFINKNCNRDVAEQFVFHLLKEGAK